ncbi:MAG: helix-turn-helix domain-containing protein [Clostridium sp.]|uniref:winged helix-turn-helix transcriptional regulator n=1 Tax=Clostridium sp. TaxID=1506 RepID=UPI00290D6CCF|nr:helix-turn-helix domain-containing protein [Clostridium sp.]MDU7336692.1 helix-turn-helix domain-containing protein [Clostridium sp.]
MEKDLFGICPYVTVQKMLTGKWTILILYQLSMKTMRFNELQRALPRLTQATLTKQLHMMQDNGLIERTVYNQIPPKVEYSLSQLGRNFQPVLDAVGVWGEEYIACIKEKVAQ